eukprot:6129269-Ditylum_brightwellii.AAC.1
MMANKRKRIILHNTSCRPVGLPVHLSCSRCKLVIKRAQYKDLKCVCTHLNTSEHVAFEADKVITSADIMHIYGGELGKPYPQNVMGVLIGKKPD